MNLLPTVILPIHNGADALDACLASLVRTLPAEADLELVDDASTDRAVDAIVAAFVARRGATRFTRQARNLGFVRTVNAAMARTRRDVVLLNSDTVTTSGWLEGLARCAASDPTIATATPFSNNAEICSIPDFCKAGPVPADVEAWARAVAADPPEYPSLPTGVGFCMFMRRAALEAVGDFDADTFGRGYGEENDWCLRAELHGYRHVLCDDVFVAHRGGASFAPLGLAPNGENLQRLLARYPDYHRRVADFIAADPIAPRRTRALARLREALPA